jgi:secondary thiamine-phosphate synthase enzyme
VPASHRPRVFNSCAADRAVLVEHFSVHGWVVVEALEPATIRALPGWIDEVAALPEGADGVLQHFEGTDAGSILCRSEAFVPVHAGLGALLCHGTLPEIAGALLAYLRHTSASLVIQENADPDVQTDLVTALDRLAPADAGWVHASEGPDDRPAHVKAMVNGVSLHIPVIGGKLATGTWQGLYLAEHRTRPHRRDIVLQFIGSRR